MNLSMPTLNAVEATRMNHCIVGLSMHDEAEQAQPTRDAGGVDLVTKSAPRECIYPQDGIKDRILTLCRAFRRLNADSQSLELRRLYGETRTGRPPKRPHPLE